MAKLYLGIILCLTSVNALTADWGKVKAVVGGNSVEIATPERQATLIWPSKVVPGEELLVMKTAFSRFQETFFKTYHFVGVVGNSLQINATGSHQGKGASSPLPSRSMEKTLFVERASDGMFYFVPEDIKGEGVIKIQRSPEEPGFYLVTLSRQSQ